jgi:hypothetical protein
VLLDQQAQQHPLGEVRVLVLVHEHVLEAPRRALAHVRALVQQLEGAHDQVPEVERAALLQQAVVVGVEAGELALAVGVGALGIGRGGKPLGPVLQLLRRHQLVLEPVDARDEAGQQRRRIAADLVVAQRQLADPVEQERQAVGGGGGSEERVDAGLERLVAQQLHAEGVERRDVQLLIGRLQQRLESLAHLGAGRAREGQGQNAVGGRALLDQPREAAGERAGLPGAGAGHHQQRPPGMGDDRALVRVQAVEQVGHADLGYAARCADQGGPELPSSVAETTTAATASAIVIIRNRRAVSQRKRRLPR